MATFGHTGEETGASATATNYKVVSKFTLSEGALVSKLSVYAYNSGATAHVVGFIYADSAGAPGARRGVTQEATLPDDGANYWYDLTFSGSVLLSPGDYWLGLNADSSVFHHYVTTVTNNRKYKSETYSTNPANPFGTVDGTDNNQLSIYATYDPAPVLQTFKRFYGPAQLSDSAADLYTVPASTVARVMGIHASNPSGSPVDLTLSIGADGAATRVYDGYSLAADGVLDDHSPYELAAGEKIQGFASSAATVNLTITGWEKPA